jgi:hypothetical protein
MELLMLSFIRFLQESLVNSDQQFPSGKGWYNSKTGKHTVIDPAITGGILGSRLEPATYHSGFVVKNPEYFGISPEEMHDSILRFENPQHPELQTPEGQKRLAKKRVEQLASGYSDTHPGVESLVMNKGWVRINKTGPSSVHAQGKAPALLNLGRRILHLYPDITSLNMDMHGAAETYGHINPNIIGIHYSLEGRDVIQDFVERGGAPHRSYSRLVFKQQKSPLLDNPS